MKKLQHSDVAHALLRAVSRLFSTRWSRAKGVARSGDAARKSACATLLLLAIPAFAGFDRISGPQPGQSVGVLPPGVTPPQLEGVGVDEHLGRAVDLKLQFTDETGYQVPLESFFHKDRPVILDLVYYTCPMLCNLILNGQVDAMKELAWTPGTNYEVVTISFDPKDSFDLARQKKEIYLGVYGRPAPGWHFLTDYHGNAKKLAEEIGYHYRYDARQEQFAHTSAIMVLTPEGKLARYLYGIRFRSRDLRFALTEAAEGRSTATIDRILLWCYHYDPTANAYVLFATNVMKVGGVLTVLIMGFFLWRLFRAERLRAVGGAGLRPASFGR
jgi:protein SCO1/2